MDQEIIIKQEPLDDIEPESNFDCQEDHEFDNFKAVDKIKVEFEEELIHFDLMKKTMVLSTTSTENDQLSILGEKSNLITVSASEPINPLDECYISEELDEQNDHVNTQLNDNDSQSFLKQEVIYKAAKNQTSHECRKNCGKKFETLTERALHESHEHKSVPRTIKCNFCNKIFESFFALTRHMPEHRNVQRYVCTHCSKCCTSYQDLQNHWKSSGDCSKGGSSKGNDIPEAEIERPRKISILRSTLSPENKDIIQNKTAFSYQKNSLLDILPQGEIPPKESRSLLLMPHLPQFQSKPLSFADETKAFAAKYQLKTSLVAKKRTSALVINPTNNQKVKKTKKLWQQDFDITPKYAVPKAIGPSNSDVVNPFLNIKIKEELPDTYDEFNPLILNEIKVKNEPIDDYFEDKNESLDEPIEEPFISAMHENEIVSDLNKDIEIPKSNYEKMVNKVPKMNATSLKGFKIIKLNSNNKLMPLGSTGSPNSVSLKNVKIIKLAPNAKIIKVPTVKMESVKTLTDKTMNSTATINESESQTSQTIPFIPIKISHSSSQSHSYNISYTNDMDILENEISIQKNDENITSELLEMAEKTTNKGSQRKRINSVPRQVLRFIEQQPENLKLIEELQRQMKLAESFSTTNIPILEDYKDKGSPIKEQENSATESCKSTNAPRTTVLSPLTSMYLLITENIHPELVKAKREHRDFRFSWMCPRCPKRYEQKHAFMGHLVSAHGLCREEFTKLIVEVRPFPNKGLKAAKKSNSSNECKQSTKLKEKTLKNEFEEKLEKNVKIENLSTSRWCCPNCNRSCSSRTMLVNHMAGNCSRVPLYQCSKCTKSFYSASTLNCHMTIHTGELPYSCSYCDKRFRTRGQVTVHHRIHTGERPFKCQICSQAFTHRETLISHLSRHIGMKRYRCYACGKHFSCVSGLKTHHEFRPNTCGRVKLNTRAVGPRVRVVRGQVLFEPQPEINPYLRTEDPQDILSEIQNIQKTVS